jgi:magnesium chelatase subunit H
LKQAEELRTSADAAARFLQLGWFLPANVGLAIENGGWEDETQLQEQLLTRYLLSTPISPV